MTSPVCSQAGGVAEQAFPEQLPNRGSTKAGIAQPDQAAAPSLPWGFSTCRTVFQGTRAGRLPGAVTAMTFPMGPEDRRVPLRLKNGDAGLIPGNVGSERVCISPRRIPSAAGRPRASCRARQTFGARKANRWKSGSERRCNRHGEAPLQRAFLIPAPRTAGRRAQPPPGRYAGRDAVPSAGARTDILFDRSA